MSEGFKAGQKVRIISNTNYAGHFYDEGDIVELISGIPEVETYTCETYAATNGVFEQNIQRSTFEVIPDEAADD